MRSEGTAGSGPDDRPEGGPDSGPDGPGNRPADEPGNRPADGPADGPDTVIAGRYRLLRQLGRGGMGVVWEALDTTLDRKVAVKGLLYPGSAGPDDQAKWVSRARREAQAIARIGHQNVVAVHDVIEDGNQVWIVMELLDSRSLADLLREQQQLSVPHAARIGLQVLRGLAAVHEAGVLHRDVKPHNVLFRPNGRALLMDFGIATFEGASQVTRSHEIIGTPQYLAPELLSHTPENPVPASAASDLWALGVTLYEMVEGRRPFDGASSFEVLIAVREAPMPPMKYAGPLGGLIEALLRKDPGRRPDAAEAARMLRAVTEGVAARDTPGVQPAGAAPPKPAESAGAARGGPVSGGVRSEGAGRRRGRWKVTATVACAALLASAAWFTWVKLAGTSEAAGSDKGAATGGPRFSDTHDELRVGVKDDQPGLSVRTGDTYRGFEVDLAYAIADELDFSRKQVKFVPVTSDNRDDYLRQGKVDLVLATYSMSKEREKTDGVKFAGSYYEALKGLLVRKNRRYNDLSDLQNDDSTTVCTARNSAYVSWLEDEGLGDRTEVRDGYEKCVSALLDPKSHVYAVATDDVIVAGLAHKYADKTKALSSLGGSENYGVAMDPEERGLHREVCTALAAVMKSPGRTSQWAEIYDRHLKPITGQSAPRVPELTSSC
ncbi:serine/threonine-protein kinase [Streptomyces odontomachi]|uniref:serine/threonine-protein kinase n=1 Tax=Streptomyces odontomachi TaxID=2944940 RepID=UPI00210E70A1|nr:serine/threonine-protein kinase [Streptomyces sp. ODS25]